jgi:hypothetical protein
MKQRKKIAVAFVSVLSVVVLFFFQNCSQVDFSPSPVDRSTAASGVPASSTNTYAWISSGWGACSLSCGGGLQTQTVTCQFNGDTVDASNCSGVEPATSQACNVEACVGEQWVASGFGTCSKTCGGGTQTQTVTCQDSSGATVANSSCTDTEPVTSQACNTQACLTYNWVQSGFGACSATCGGGAKTQTVTCKDNLGNTVANSLCTGAMPSNVQACNTQACTPACNFWDPYGTADSDPMQTGGCIPSSGQSGTCAMACAGALQACTPSAYCTAATCNVYCTDIVSVPADGPQGG